MANKRMMHIGLCDGDIGQYVFLPGSPERSEKISTYLDDAREVAYNREFRTFTGYLDGTKVSVCSTGMGCPSTATAARELYEIGARVLMRVGSCASTSKKVSMGDVVIPNAAVRMEGVADHFVPVEFPPVPDMDMVEYLEQAAVRLGYSYNVGVTISKASFYTQIAAETKPYGYELANRWNSFEKGGATSTEMESSALFVIAEWLRIRAAAVLISATDYKTYTNVVKKKNYKEFEHRAIEVAIEAMRQIIRDDKASASVVA